MNRQLIAFLFPKIDFIIILNLDLAVFVVLINAESIQQEIIKLLKGPLFVFLVVNSSILKIYILNKKLAIIILFSLFFN
jgi:hypothetical protein